MRELYCPLYLGDLAEKTIHLPIEGRTNYYFCSKCGNLFKEVILTDKDIEAIRNFMKAFAKFFKSIKRKNQK